MDVVLDDKHAADLDVDGEALGIEDRRQLLLCLQEDVVGVILH